MSSPTPAAEEAKPLQDVDPREFDALVLGSPGRKLVLFHALWCGASVASAKGLAAWLKRFGAGLPAYHVPVEDAPELVRRFSVVNLPTLLMLDGAAVVARHEGAFDAAVVLQMPGVRSQQP